MSKFQRALDIIDAKNSEDPNKDHYEGKEYPKELLYSIRMLDTLLHYFPDAGEPLKIAARAQHICRWKIPRESYPMDRTGYLKWREDLKKMHAQLTSDILEEVGYEEELINRVSFLIRKKLLKKDSETQILEDVICLVFLKFYLEDFASKHEDEKIVDILEKTWIKMSEKGHRAALAVDYPSHMQELIKMAILKNGNM